MIQFSPKHKEFSAKSTNNQIIVSEGKQKLGKEGVIKVYSW